MQAELVSSLTVSKLKVGEVVLAKLTKEWTVEHCTMPRGAVVSGRVTSLTPKSQSSKVSSVGLLFEANCGEAVTQPLLWIALLAPDNSGLAGLHDGNPVAVQALRNASFGEGGGIGSSGIESHVDMSGRQNPSLPAFLGPAPDRSHPRPTSVFTGQVWGLEGMTLSAGTGTLGSSVLSSKKKSLQLPVGTVLVLSGTSTPLPPQAAAASAETRPVRPAAVTQDEPAFALSEACQPATCAVAPHGGGEVASSVTPVQTISLGGLNYHRLRSAEMMDLEFGAALAYLGPDRLLFTFNPHGLITRSAQDDPVSQPHMVTAVVFNLRTSAIEARYSWRVGDDRQYLWQLTGDRVLLHDGERLRMLAPDLEGAGLKEIAAVPLSSRLAFVRIAPDRRHLAVGVVRELHTPDVHAKLVEANVNGAEEEVLVMLLDAELAPIEKTRQSSFAMPPVLSDRGLVTLLHGGGERWRYQEKGWGGEVRTVARLRSACIPEMTSLSSGLFFVSGCDTRASSRWYRVLRSDGSVALKGTLLSGDMKPLPVADLSGNTFGLALPTAREGYVPTSPFHGVDLSSEAVRVFRSADGRTVFSMGMHAPAPTKQPMAFAPDGAQLAVLDGDEVKIFALGPTAASSSVHVASKAGAPDATR